MKRVVVGLSGGVDSSVTAHLLIQQGYEVIGMFMRNWHDESVTLSDECPWIDDSNDALLIAQQLNIPFQVIDLSKEYKERIVDYMFSEYEAGRTPNPDVLCNREIKFDVFLKAAMELGADYVATGHYCRKIEHEDGTFGLLAGKDPNKDQSYFLCQLSQEQLAKALFPIGELLKSEVREIASEIGLVTADKKDSQGLCFVGKISLPVFLQQQLAQKKGNIVEIPDTLPQFSTYHSLARTEENLEQLVEPFTFHESDGIKVHEHIGAHYYTIGQRKGLHIGGRPNPSFVIGIDTATNTVYTGQEETHPGLNRIALFIANDEINYINSKYILNTGDSLTCRVRIRYRQPLQNATLYKKEDGLYILFDELQKGITPGQFAAFYLGEELIGSGVIMY
ncbi:tRNA 2-thiouridine(34) synthase MnmA [Crocinitomicaceae bacterium CZZ-1]|uniref:tRNA-specific 2-thiouridylase MnmA n=1 Tax=Taishania pollutisoli TaxID=2766479 RepID=A0A8J6PJC4_9FLAO|nr:tRNA 2-thiouridine(34) synthase MnmA [Taishania pollutisoli]MBC9812704.1 tRNA 2-thiouridine(34) synthase MnmA [Taishania pollutisoli]